MIRTRGAVLRTFMGGVPLQIQIVAAGSAGQPPRTLEPHGQIGLCAAGLERADSALRDSQAARVKPPPATECFPQTFPSWRRLHASGLRVPKCTISSLS